MFRIGDFSRLCNDSIKALRFYDEVGLLKPTFVDSATGYRYYSANLQTRLNRIRIFKELGFSLDEIALLLREGFPREQVRNALQSRRKEIARRIAEERDRLVQIEAWLNQIEGGDDLHYDITIREIGPQMVASVRDGLTSYDEAAQLFEELEGHLKKHNPGKQNVSGRQAAIWHGCAGQAEDIDCEALVFLNRPVPETNRISVYELQTGFNACLLHEGADASITNAYRAAHSWIKSNNYAIAGPLWELYWKGGVEKNDAFGVTEIRYPVNKQNRKLKH